MILAIRSNKKQQFFLICKKYIFLSKIIKYIVPWSHINQLKELLYNIFLRCVCLRQMKQKLKRKNYVQKIQLSQMAKQEIHVNNMHSSQFTYLNLYESQIGIKTQNQIQFVKAPKQQQFIYQKKKKKHYEPKKYNPNTQEQQIYVISNKKINFAKNDEENLDQFNIVDNKEIKKRNQDQSNQQLLQFFETNKQKGKSKCYIKNLISHGDLVRFIKLCSNIYPNSENIEIFFSEQRPLLFCQLGIDGKKQRVLFGDIVHQNRVRKNPVDIQLFWRTYDILYKQVPEDFWGIAKFGMVKAEEKSKFWTKTINIYKHKQLLKLYFVAEKKQIHFLLLHKQFRRMEYSSSYIEERKLNFPHQYRCFEKLKNYLLGKRQNLQVEGQEQDSDGQQMKEQQKEDQQQQQRILRELLDKDISWFEEQIKNMNEQLQEMDFGEKRKQLYQEAKSAQKMMIQFQKKRKQIKQSLNTKRASAIELKSYLKVMIILEKQLQSKLPICAKKNQIFHLFEKQSVIVLQGETGCGKSTQLPQMLFEYYQITNTNETLPVLITQPRKIATRSLAYRVAEELQEKIHGLVDYQTSMNKNVNHKAKIIFKHDRLVLNQLTEDPLLSRYCCLVVDEAHERTISIDVILGCLKFILQKREDFKVIITSASMDAKRFGEYFNVKPIKIPGRLYPVQQIYQPLPNIKDTRQKIIHLIRQHIFQKDLSKLKDIYYGHVLIFCPSIQDAQYLVKKFSNNLNDKSFLVMPLHSKLSSEQQKAVFKDQGKVKIIFATKIAETSITIDGVKIVVNTGIDRELVYDQKTKVTSLQYILISQSQATQRAGRAGRTSSGFCFHLYSQEQKNMMLANKPPQIIVMPLDTVVLRLKALKIRHINKFSFIDQPKEQNIKISTKVLQLLGCLDVNGEITDIGRLVLHFPIQPFLARCIVQALFVQQALKQINKSQVMIGNQQTKKLNNIKIRQQVTKILCLIINAQDLYVKTKKEANDIKNLQQKDSDKQLHGYNLQQFEGQFDLFGQLYKDYQSLKSNIKLLNQWSNHNKISLKNLDSAKQAYEQIFSIILQFAENIQNTQFFKLQLKKRLAMVKESQGQKQLINYCLLTSFVNYLSLYSDVPELGYTMIAQQTPTLLDSTTIMFKKSVHSKWLVSFNIVVDHFNRINAKIAQPVSISLIKKVMDKQIFQFLQMGKIQQFNPYYHQFKYQIPSIVFYKVLADYKKRNFDSDMEFLCPFTFVFDQKRSTFTAYHLSTTPKHILNEKLDDYLGSIRKPLTLPVEYKFANQTSITFNSNFELTDIDMKNIHYGIKISSREHDQNLIKQAISQIKTFPQFQSFQLFNQKTQHSHQRNVYRRITQGDIYLKGIVSGNKNLQLISEKLKKYQKILDIDTQQVQLCQSENTSPQLLIQIEINYVGETGSKILKILLTHNKIISADGQVQTIFNQIIKQQIEQLKYLKIVKVSSKRNLILCYSLPNSSINQNKIIKILQRSHLNYQIGQIPNFSNYYYQITNQQWIRKIKLGLKQDLLRQYYQKYDLKFQKRCLLRQDHKFKDNNKSTKIQDKNMPSLAVKYSRLRIQFKIISRSKKLLHLIQNFVSSILYKDKPQNLINNQKVRLPPEQLAQLINVNTRIQQVYRQFTVASNIFDALSNYFYSNYKNQRHAIIYHKKCQDYRGIAVTDILAKYNNKGYKIYHQQNTKIQIQKIFTPHKVKIESKYQILFHHNLSKSKANKFLDQFQASQNYDIKLIFDQKSQMMQIYCQQQKKYILQQKLLVALQNQKLIIKTITYSEKGLNKILNILKESSLQNFTIDYPKKQILISANIEVMEIIQKKVNDLTTVTVKQCQICCQSFTEPYRLLNCGHTFCFTCLRNTILRNGSQKKCPQICQSKINIYDIKRLITQQQFKQICDEQVRKQISISTEYFFCYSPDCPQIFNYKQCKQLKDTYKCKKCNQSYCVKCKNKKHQFRKCQQQLNEQEQFLKLGIRKCEKCYNLIQKTSGCNHMTCKCGAHFCWICGNSYQTATECYAHLNMIHGGIYDDRQMNNQIRQVQALGQYQNRRYGANQFQLGVQYLNQQQLQNRLNYQQIRLNNFLQNNRNIRYRRNL